MRAAGRTIGAMSAPTVPSRRRAMRAFTLLELLVVIVILSVLALLAVPSFASVTDRAAASNTEVLVGSTHRELSALAVFDGDSLYSIDDLDAAAADLPAATSQAPAVTFTDGPAVTPGQISWAFSDDGTLLGLASSGPDVTCMAAGPVRGAVTWCETLPDGVPATGATALARHPDAPETIVDPSTPSTTQVMMLPPPG